MVNGVLLCMGHPEAVGESFNVGNERDVITIYGLANTIVRVLDSQSEIKFIPKTYVDVELRVPVVDKIKRLLGFSAKVDLEEGVRRTAEYYRQPSPNQPTPAAAARDQIPPDSLPHLTTDD